MRQQSTTFLQKITLDGVQGSHSICPTDSFNFRQLSKLLVEYDLSWHFCVGGVGLDFRTLAVVVLWDTDEQMQYVSTAAAAVVQLENRFIIPACWAEAKLRAKSKCRGSASVESSRRRKKWQCKFPSSTYTLPHSLPAGVWVGDVSCASTHTFISRNLLKQGYGAGLNVEIINLTCNFNWIPTSAWCLKVLWYSSAFSGVFLVCFVRPLIEAELQFNNRDAVSHTHMIY